MNWAYTSIIQAFVITLIFNLIWIVIYKITANRQKQ